MLAVRPLRHHRLGRDQEACNRGRPLKRVTHNLHRVDNALACEIPVLARLSVVAKAIGCLFEDLGRNHRAVFASVGCDLAGRPGERLPDDGSGAVSCSFSLLIRGHQRARCQAEIPLTAPSEIVEPSLRTMPIHATASGQDFSDIDFVPPQVNFCPPSGAPLRGVAIPPAEFAQRLFLCLARLFDARHAGFAGAFVNLDVERNLLAFDEVRHLGACQR